MITDEEKAVILKVSHRLKSNTAAYHFNGFIFQLRQNVKDEFPLYFTSLSVEDQDLFLVRWIRGTKFLNHVFRRFSFAFVYSTRSRLGEVDDYATKRRFLFHCRVSERERDNTTFVLVFEMENRKKCRRCVEFQNTSIFH